jgi:hypothetical protein
LVGFGGSWWWPNSPEDVTSTLPSDNKTEPDFGHEFVRRWRRVQAMKTSDSKGKVVALTLSFPKVPRTRAGVPCASSEMRRKTEPRHTRRTAKTANIFSGEL